MVALPWSRPRANGRLLRFCDNEVVEFDCYSEGDELRCVEVGGSRSERWPRASAALYSTADGPLYLLNADIPQVSKATDLVNLESRIAFSALNEATQDSMWTYTTIGLAACCLCMVLVLAIAWMTSRSADEAATYAKLVYDAFDKLPKVTPTPIPTPVR